MELIETLTESSLKDMQADIDHYVQGKDVICKKKEEKKSMPNPLKGVAELFSPISSLFSEKEANSTQKKLVIKASKTDAMNSCLTLYDVFKKSHRMITW